MNAGRKRPADGYPPHPVQAVPRTRKKPTDKTLPKVMEEQSPEEYKLYNQLREAEARVDATILRKRFDLLDALNRPLKVVRLSLPESLTLKCQKKIRLSLSSTPVDQPWQNSGKPLETFAYDFDTDNIPSWTFTLRGKLLNSDPEVPVQPMTSYFKSIIIDFDRASDAYAEPNRVEWHKTNEATQKMYDYVQCTRKGDSDVNVKVSLTVDATPERYKLSDEFADILQIREDTRPGIVMALWQYIKVCLPNFVV
jgi:SWI/SNF-related matrix-associated actin-dependent regulator of chromatin subfamily D